jgi:hypothetical protein
LKRRAEAVGSPGSAPARRRRAPSRPKPTEKSEPVEATPPAATEAPPEPAEVDPEAAAEAPAEAEEPKPARKTARRTKPKTDDATD